MVIKRDYKIIADCVKQSEETSFTIELAHNMIGQLDFGVDECDIKHYIDARIAMQKWWLLQKCQPTSASVER